MVPEQYHSPMAGYFAGLVYALNEQWSAYASCRCFGAANQPDHLRLLLKPIEGAKTASWASRESG